jgi:hypothetical protein
MMQEFTKTHEERMMVQEQMREGMGEAASSVLNIGSDDIEDEQALNPQSMRDVVKRRMEEMRIRAGIVDPDRLLAEAPSVLPPKPNRVAAAVSSSAPITRVVRGGGGKKGDDDSE